MRRGTFIASKVRVKLQTETAECGVACLAMILDYWGSRVSVQELRSRFGISSRGMTLAQLAQLADASNLDSRAVKLDLEDVSRLRLPCIIHWELNHFVVLEAVNRRGLVIADPARGRRRITHDEFSAKFTGVALELTPAAKFERRASPPRVSFSRLAGSVHGLAPALAQLLALSLTLQLFVVVGPLLIQVVLDQVVVNGDTSLLTTICLGFFAILAFQAAVTAMRSWSALALSADLGFQWASNVLRHLLRLPTSYFERRQLGDIMSRIGSVEALKEAATNVAVNIVIDGLVATTMAIVLLVYSPKLAAISFVALGIYLALRMATYSVFLRANEEELVLSASEGSHLLESLRGHLTIKATGAEVNRHSGWKSLAMDALNQRLKIGRMNITFSAASQVIQGVDRILVVWLGAHLVMDSLFSIGMLIAYLSYKDQFSSKASTLLDALFSLRMLRIHVERLSDVVLSPPEISDGPGAHVVVDGELSIEARDVSFRYSDLDPLVIKSFSVCIAPGEVVAIAGPSGCGKTTLLKVMFGLLQPTSGVVLVNGLPLDKFGVGRLRSIAGSVLQEDQLFAGSIADNIAFGATEVDISGVVAAARAASVHDEIVAMQMGYNTLVGDMGIVFSSGQKQRLILARALYRKPKILFLDEATSHLDAENERAVAEAVRQLGITTIVVAHLPETLKRADRVITLMDGSNASGSPLVEVVTH